MAINSHTPAISIIMPCFNRADTIEQSINSVLSQSFSDWALIIIDDGSSDSSRALVLRYKDPRITLHTQQNTGVCGARNAGLRLATGEMIAFLDADDTWDPECLTQLHRSLHTSNAALAYCGWQNIGLSGGQGEPFIPPDYETPKKMPLLFENCRWPIHACLTYKTVIINAGMFNESIQTSEDFLLWLHIAAKHSLILVPDVLAYYHFHESGQASNNKAKTAINHYLAQEMFLIEHPEYQEIFGRADLKRMMLGELLRRGFDCYWKRDLGSARRIFKKVMGRGYGTLYDWKHMLPSLLPYKLHNKLLTSRK